MPSVEYKADCLDCGAVWTSKNAHAVAVQHHRKTGHTVIVEKTSVWVYGKNPRSDVVEE